MTIEIVQKLCSTELLTAIEENIERSPQSIALDKRVCEPSIVATQVKYLQRAKSKLPEYYAARCILPPLSFEQASSQELAATKSIEGERVLDLTCGLGVDTLSLSKRFKWVTSIERDEVLAEVARENFRRLGATNIEVVCSSAEEFLAHCTTHYDWIYADPDRRSAEGKKLVRLEDCSPNILALEDDIARVTGGRLMLKNSPLFDVDEAFRLFSPAVVEVISLGGECKEVVVCSADEDLLTARAIHHGSVSVRPADITNPALPTFTKEEYRYLLTPDVALQKARLARHVLSPIADIWSNNGFGFARTAPDSEVLARIEEIESIEDYNPRALRKLFAGQGIEILKRDVELSVAQIAKQLKVKEGGKKRVAFTKIEGEYKVVILK